jgi:hypothetical protein
MDHDMWLQHANGSDAPEKTGCGLRNCFKHLRQIYQP